jgi:hypothetical protein
VGSGAQCHDASARCLRVIHARDLAASVFIELVSLAPQGLGFCAGGRSSRRTTRSVEKRRRYKRTDIGAQLADFRGSCGSCSHSSIGVLSM